MRNFNTRSLTVPALAACAAAIITALAGAQQAAVPKLADGHPDLSGTWDNGAGIDFVQPKREGESVCFFGCPGGGTLPDSVPQTSVPKYRAEFAARVADLDKRQVEEDPILRCAAPGVPRIGPPDKIVQRAGEVAFLYEDVSGNFYRVVPTDGRPHPKGNEPSFLGDAVAHWEGDTLVVETVNFNGQSWLTDNGAFSTKDLRVVERLRRTPDTLEWSATAYDSVLAQPWELTKRTAKLTDLEIVESPPCIDRSLQHMVDDSHHTNPR